MSKVTLNNMGKTEHESTKIYKYKYSKTKHNYTMYSLKHIMHVLIVA